MWKVGIGTRLNAPSSRPDPVLDSLLAGTWRVPFCSSAARRDSTALSRVASPGSLAVRQSVNFVTGWQTHGSYASPVVDVGR